MKAFSLNIISAIFMVFSHFAGSNQADDTTITITGHTPGATPFISKLTLEVSDTRVLKSIEFTITPKPGSVTRPLSATYSNDYLVNGASNTHQLEREKSFCQSTGFTMDIRTL